MTGATAAYRTPRPVAASTEELLAGATSRVPMVAADSKSGATFERVVIGGERYVVKHVSTDNDWIARALGDLGPWTVLVWESGLLDLVPDCIDHTYAGAARQGSRGAVLMHDVGPLLVPGEVVYHLALNRARVPAGISREETVAEYRAALERHGIDTGPWWDRQLPLALLGMMVLLGWEKALGPSTELEWWSERVLEGVELL